MEREGAVESWGKHATIASQPRTDGKVSGETSAEVPHLWVSELSCAGRPSLPQWQQCSPQWSPSWCSSRCHHSRRSTGHTWPSRGGPLRTTAPSEGLPHLGRVEKSQGSKGSSKMGLRV